MKPVYDVIAMLHGSAYPDQWIVRGNHHDGWVFGASDPLTGQVALMSEAKALGALYRQGWRPARTIVYASWDGEEPGLLGSTEWAEAHAAELKQKALLYINTDNNGRGFLRAEGSHELQHFVNQAANDVADPQDRRFGGASAAAPRSSPRAYMGRLARNARRGRRCGEGRRRPAARPARLGLGLHAPSCSISESPRSNLGFGGEDESAGSYHSVYDSFYHVTHFDDPGPASMAPLCRRSSADSCCAPPMHRGFPPAIATSRRPSSRYLTEIKKLAADQREKDRTLADLRREGDFTLASSPTDPIVAPADRGITPLIDMLPLENAVDHLKRAASAADAMLGREEAFRPRRRRGSTPASPISTSCCSIPQGLPGRPWFQNLVYAPGTLTGYGAKTLPGVREAIEQRRWDDARTYVVRTAKVLEDYANRLDEAVAMARTP